MKKPYKGVIEHWTKLEMCPAEKGEHLGYIYSGYFNGHPEFRGMFGRTSLVVKHTSALEFETLNSRYTLGSPSKFKG